MWQSVLAFAAVAGLLTVTPGADTVLVLQVALRRGRREAMVTGVGVCCGVFFWGGAAAAGLTAVLAASETLYTILRVAGAAYLSWLAWGMLRRSYRGDPLPPPGAQADEAYGPGHAFRRGLLTNLLNPKVGVFYLTLLPQFIPTGAPVAPLTLLLTAIHSVEGLLWFLLVSLLAGRLGRFLRGRSVSRWIDRLSAAVFAGFGLRLLLERR